MEETVAPEESGQVTEEVNPLAFDPGSLPEGLRAEPSLQTFDSVDKLAKSYVNAVKKIGSDPSSMVQLPKEGESWDNFYNQVGRPETPEGYEFVKTDMFLGLLSPKSDILVDSVHSPPSCINKVRCREVLGLTSIIDRNDPSVQYGFTHNWYGWSSGGEYYYLNKHPPEIKQRYVDYLKNKGITTCSCFDHYDQTTLYYDGVYLDFKDFKKRIIKKLITENNKKIKSTERKYDKKRLQVERVKNRLKEVEKEENKLLEDVDKHKGLENKFKDALK